MHELGFESQFLWLNALLSLDAVRRDLVLTQINEPGFVDSSSWEALFFLRGGCGVRWGEVGNSGRRGMERELWLVCKIHKNLK